MRKLWSIALAVCVFAMVCTLPPVGTSNASLNNSASDWMKNSVYGIDVNVPMLLGKTWDQSVAAFDVNTLANQAEQAGASYVQLDIGQNSGYYASPNATYNSYAGYSPGVRTSTRDLPMDMANALAPKGIKLFIYIPSNPPENDQQARNGLGWPGTGYVTPTQNSIKRWGEVLKEWGDRYGSKLAGWWFDGCYNPGAYTGTYDFNYFVAQAKSGYSGRLVSINSGIGLSKPTDYADLTAGELNDIKLIPSNRWWYGLQWHTYSYIGNSWNSSTLAYSNQYLIDYLATLERFGGTATLNVAADAGVIPSNVLNQLIAVKSALKDNVGTKHVWINSSSMLGLAYTGTWTNSTNRDYGSWAPGYAYYNKLGDINFDAMITQTNNDSVEYTFNGTGVVYIGEKGPSFGNVDVYVDGVFMQTVNAYAATSTYTYTEYLYSIEGLPLGNHTIKLVKKSGSYMLVDAFGVSNLGPQPLPSIVSGAPYKIYNKNSGKVLEVYGGSTAMGAAIDQWPDENTPGKKWVITDVGGGYYKLINVGSGYGLDIPYAYTTYGVQLQQWLYQGNTNQQFQLVPTSDGYFKIIARHSGLALDVYNASTANGASVIQWPYEDNDNQKWWVVRQ
ncbi:RICIN domain-containing protein [Cohnella soli]|uniref:RICIN domain-containing protein n=1 Tax=Cohnella soli TaxID=425005 RepID=A0ABW0I118_9BACL